MAAKFQGLPAGVWSDVQNSALSLFFVFATAAAPIINGFFFVAKSAALHCKLQ